MKDVVVVSEAVKKYRDTVVLKNVNLRIPEGSICGLVGRNGSGKTVLMKSICGMIPLNHGEIRVFDQVIGKNIEFAPDTGFIIEHPGFLPQYSGIQNLKFLSEIKGKPCIDKLEKLMELTGLDPKEKKKVGKYSMGMRQRLGIAQAIMDSPRLLILDEPFNGLDHQGVKDMHGLLLKLNKAGTTILLASHNMDDICTLCGEVYQMDAGEISKIQNTPGTF